MMHKEISFYLSHLIPLLELRGINIIEQKEIPYGLQLKLSRGNDRANINLYHSAKRGLSKVIGAPQNSSLKHELGLLILGEPELKQDFGMHFWHSWIGSDECGKGDYFGPLVVSSFYLRREQEQELLKLGVCDSKKLRDPDIVKIAKKLYLAFPGQSNCLLIRNQRYNQLIQTLKEQGRNLNDLMAWAHEKVITELLKQCQDCEGVLVDQFSRAQKVKSRLGPKFPDLNIIERTGAERDPAVAAASILARYQFLLQHQALDAKFKMKFPLGANQGVIKAAKDFVTNYGKERLGEVAKLHFRTTLQVIND
nr:ribonuclease [Candidatus Cloacimonadota bacterium]